MNWYESALLILAIGFLLFSILSIVIGIFIYRTNKEMRKTRESIENQTKIIQQLCLKDRK